jgi:hypothetical protein
MNALSLGLGIFTVEHVFAGSLLGGLSISLVLFLSVSRLPIRFKGLRRLRRVSRKDSEHLPSFLPATVGISITCFGLFGLIARELLQLNELVSIAVAIGLSTLLFSWLVSASRRFLTNTGRPMEGTTLVGSEARVCLAIPEDGVGAIAYTTEGKRHTMPARSSTALDVGSRVLVTDLHRRIAVVEELDVWLSTLEAK